MELSQSQYDTLRQLLENVNEQAQRCHSEGMPSYQVALTLMEAAVQFATTDELDLVLRHFGR